MHLYKYQMKWFDGEAHIQKNHPEDPSLNLSIELQAQYEYHFIQTISASSIIYGLLPLNQF